MIKKYLIKILIFILFLMFFTFIYNFNGKTFLDSLYISTSFQTFTGTSMVEKDENIKKIATCQMIISYIFITIFVYIILHNGKK